MKIKRYVVNNMNEAMNMIRYELGREAVIISQRKVRKPGFWGFFSKKSLEDIFLRLVNKNGNL